MPKLNSEHSLGLDPEHNDDYKKMEKDVAKVFTHYQNLIDLKQALKVKAVITALVMCKIMNV